MSEEQSERDRLFEKYPWLQKVVEEAIEKFLSKEFIEGLKKENQ